MLSSMLLEREGELAVVSAALARARAGDGAVLVVEGPAGIGKTALLDEARGRAAAAGMRLLAARGGELEADFPFGVVVSCLSRSSADSQAASGGRCSRVPRSWQGRC